MSEADRVRLRHMLEAAEEALAISHDRSRIAFLAVMKDIEIIGEAASKLTPELRAAAADVPWTDIIGMRNRLIHAYFDIDPRIVWETVTQDLPGLAQRLKELLAS